eukprot:9477084-Pyramimonas_sp.AAC.2
MRAGTTLHTFPPKQANPGWTKPRGGQATAAPRCGPLTRGPAGIPVCRDLRRGASRDRPAGRPPRTRPWQARREPSPTPRERGPALARADSPERRAPTLHSSVQACPTPPPQLPTSSARSA